MSGSGHLSSGGSRLIGHMCEKRRFKGRDCAPIPVHILDPHSRLGSSIPEGLGPTSMDLTTTCAAVSIVPAVVVVLPLLSVLSGPQSTVLAL